MKISIREYAKLVGTSHTTVNTAIKDGWIKKGYDPGSKLIDRDIADKEWGTAFRMKKANKHQAPSEEQKVPQRMLDNLMAVSIEEIQLYPDDDYPEAERKKIIIQAQRELIKLKTESGELVNKDEMYKEMFEFGKAIRAQIQAIPDRIIDQLISLTRNEAHALLSTELNKTLEKLADNEQKDISGDT